MGPHDSHSHPCFPGPMKTRFKFLAAIFYCNLFSTAYAEAQDIGGWSFAQSTTRPMVQWFILSPSAYFTYPDLTSAEHSRLSRCLLHCLRGR